MNDDYHSKENSLKYVSFSQFKSFLECENKALAKIEGRYVEPPTKALLQSSYIDAYFSGTLDEFKVKNPDLFRSKEPNKGELKSEYAICNNVIKAIEEDDEYFNMFYNGEKQVELEGVIEGVPIRGKIDFLYPNYIVDAKSVAGIDPIWDEKQRRKVPFYSYYRYDLQGAFYRELVRQNFDKDLPFYLAPVTKEEAPKKLAFLFSNDVLDMALEEIKAKIQRIDQIKKHLIEPEHCEHCPFCNVEYKFDVLDIKTIEKEDM